jgi:hypothetical protein
MNIRRYEAERAFDEVRLSFMNERDERIMLLIMDATDAGTIGNALIEAAREAREWSAAHAERMKR